MYNECELESDLVNSYAWDTAISYIQKCLEYSNYSQLGSFNINSLATKETTIDSPCNIYDMESNCVEWSTKTCANEEIPCINRGGSYKYDFDFASTRNNSILESSYEDYSFYPILYL